MTPPRCRDCGLPISADTPPGWRRIGVCRACVEKLSAESSGGLPPDDPDGSAWLSTAEAAAELGVSQASVQKWIAAGILPATRVGRAWMVQRADLSCAERRASVGWPLGRSRKKDTASS